MDMVNDSKLIDLLAFLLESQSINSHGLTHTYIILFPIC